jgi:hypothetical protein
MGQAQSRKMLTAGRKSEEHNLSKQAEDLSVFAGKELEEYHLKKHRPGCTGMFWRSDPTGHTRLTGNSNWPRDGAMLRGVVVVSAKGEKWLICEGVKQKGGEWKKAPTGAAMPFEYNNHYYLAK